MFAFNSEDDIRSRIDIYFAYFSLQRLNFGVIGAGQIIAKCAPLSGFVGVGNNLVAGFVRVLDAIKDQKSS